MKSQCDKQAILILAYKNYVRVDRICQFFQDESFVVFIHVDCKSSFPLEVRNKLEKYSNVHILPKRYKTNWGGFNLSLAIVELMRTAMVMKDVYYVHLIDESSYPIKSVQFFKEYVYRHRCCEMLEIIPFCSKRECDDRMRYYYLHDIFNIKTKVGHMISDFLVKLQTKLSFARSSYDKTLVKGESTFSLSRDAVIYILSYLRDNYTFFKRFRHTHAPDECIFSTIIARSSYKDKTIGKHRYIDWSGRFTTDSRHPAILTHSHLEEILESNALFARKFMSPYSDLLENEIDIILKGGQVDES